MNQWSAGDFQGYKAILNNTTMADTWHYYRFMTFAQTQLYSPKSEYYLKLQTLVNDDCLNVSFQKMQQTKCKMLTTRETWERWGQRYGHILYVPLSFSLNLKLIFKKSK